jgi:hypothetical protein
MTAAEEVRPFGAADNAFPLGPAPRETTNRLVEISTDFLDVQESPADRAWQHYEAVLTEGRGISESKAAHDVRVIVAIARLWECHPGGWSYFLITKKISTGRPAKSDFHPIVIHALNAIGDRTGRSTVVCAALDEWVRTKPAVPSHDIPAWIKSRHNINAIYAARRDRDRHRPTRDEKDAATHELVGLPPLGVSPLPPELHGLDGDHLVLAHLDSIRQTVEIRGVVRKVDQAWLRANALGVLGGRTTPAAPSAKPVGPVDEFMTKPEVARELYAKTLEIVAERPGFRAVTRWLEPSAGAGAFFNLLPADKRLGIDIAVKVPGVIEHDFLTYTDFGDHRYFCIGNIPFGAAIRFFNRAARVSAYIALIVSETFARPSIQRKLDRHFHLIATLPVPDMAFLLAGREVSVPTIFQIWEYREELRPLPAREAAEECADLDFLASAEGATYILQNMGENTGRSKPLGSNYSSGSHFFIRCDSAAIDILNSIKWPPRKIGANHLAKAEIIKTYKVKKRSLLSKYTH